MILLYFFHTSWCTKCRRFEQMFENLDNLDLPPVISWDAEEIPDSMIKAFDIKSLPTFALVDKDENIYGSLESPETLQELTEWYQGLKGKLKENKGV